MPSRKWNRLISLSRRLAPLVVILVISFIPNAYAVTSVGDVLCSIYAYIHSDVARGIATLAVATLGISALVGKVSWGMAVMVAVGIAVTFSAGTIVETVTAMQNCPTP